MNRLDRLTAILTQLQSKRLTKAQDIASRFDVSLRTVYRDMRALDEAGIPIIGEAGAGYSLVEGYRLPPVMFTREEALAFLLAEKLLEQNTDKEGAVHLQSAMFKIKSVLRKDEKKVLEHMSEQVAVIRKHNALQTAGKDKILQTILGALYRKKILLISYTAFESEAMTNRSIEPVGAYFAYEHWYLIAWCRMREAYRNFRVDRINEIQIGEETFADRHPSLQAYLKEIKEKEKLEKVVIKVPQSLFKYLKEQRYQQGFVMQESRGDDLYMTFMTCHLEGFARWLLMMGDQITVIEPLVLKERIVELLELMMENFKKPITY